MCDCIKEGYVLVQKMDEQAWDRVSGLLVNYATDEDPVDAEADQVLRRIIRERDEAQVGVAQLRYVAFCASVVFGHEKDAPEGNKAPFEVRYGMNHWDELERVLNKITLSRPVRKTL